MSSFVLFFGNPLIDISVKITDVSILEKYELNEDDQKEIEADVIKSILADIFGADLSLQYFPDIPNGICICLVHGEQRSLVADVGASSHFTLDFLKTSENLQRIIADAALIHVEGFFLSNRFDSCQYIVKCLQKCRKKLLSYNLNAKYVCEELTEESSYMAENADILIGNAGEFETLGRNKYKLKTVKDTISLLHNLWKSQRALANGIYNGVKEDKLDPKRFGKLFAVTHHSYPVLVAWGVDELQMETVPVPKINPDEIVDTTGAGDTFMAGFMHAILNGLHPVQAVHYAIHIATQKIRYNAAEMPPDSPPEFSTFEEIAVTNTTV